MPRMPSWQSRCREPRGEAVCWDSVRAPPHSQHGPTGDAHRRECLDHAGLARSKACARTADPISWSIARCESDAAPAERTRTNDTSDRSSVRRRAAGTFFHARPPAPTDSRVCRNVRTLRPPTIRPGPTAKVPVVSRRRDHLTRASCTPASASYTPTTAELSRPRIPI
jgi:hypothetical protein